MQNVDQDIYGRNICLLVDTQPRYAVRDVNSRTLRILGNFFDFLKNFPVLKKDHL